MIVIIGKRKVRVSRPTGPLPLPSLSIISFYQRRSSTNYEEIMIWAEKTMRPQFIQLRLRKSPNRVFSMTIGKSEDDYGDADDCFDVNESGGRDSDRRPLRYFHPKVGTFPRRSTSIQIRRGDMPGCHIKGERGERASGPI